MDRRLLLKQIALASASYPFRSAMGGQAPAGQPVIAPLFFNQVGYLPSQAKIATLVLPGASSATPFQLRSTASQQVIFKGTSSSPAHDLLSGDLTAQADFTPCQQPGTYLLEYGNHSGDPLLIAPSVYANALRLTMRSYYGQRCGCKVDLGGGYTHPACHLDAAYHPTSGRTGPVTNPGGWHDAGDYGRYIVNSGITCGTLLWAWELYPQTLHSLALDIPKNDIPQSGSLTPDYLSEIRWNLEWMLTLQDPADGGVWHKQTSEHFCAFILPQDDHLTSYIIGTGADPYKNTGATAGLAAVMAIAARCYAPYDPAFSQRCLTAAEHAFTWATAHPNVVFTNPRGIATGGYGDRQLSDELLWAAAELFRTTGKPAYEQAFLHAYANPAVIRPPSWGDVTSMALWTYALTPRASSAQTQEQVRQATHATAQQLIQQGRSNGYGHTMSAADYGWGSNSEAANQSLLLFLDHHFHPDPAAVNAALGNLHYLLGRNCLGVSWVTGLGTRPFLHPHHRPSAADTITAPWPGLLSGGPNAHPGDEVARTLPSLPPMRMWLDDQRAYSLNEIAINWNAPLVFLLAAANSLA